MELIKENFKQIRKKQKLSLEELAVKMELNRNTLSAWENGKRVPSEAKIRMLAKVMNVSPDKFSDLEPDKPISSTNISEAVPALLSLSVSNNSSQDRIKALITGIHLVNKELIDSKLIINALLTSASSIIYVKNTNLKYVTANNLFLKNLSLNKNETVSNKTDYDFFPKNEADSNDKEDRNVIITGKSIVNREGYIPGSRRRKWGLISKEPVFDAEGRIEGLVGSFVDITERKFAEEVREILEQNINAWQTAISIFDVTDKKYVFVNKAFETLTGYRPEKMYDDEAFFYETCVHPEDKKILLPYMDNPPEKRVKLIYRVIKADGTIRAVKTELFPCKKEYIKKYMIAMSEGITILGGTS